MKRIVNKKIAGLIKYPTFRAWFSEVKSLAVKEFRFSKDSVNSFDEKAWKESYIEGLSPKEALTEELTSML